MYFDQKAKPNSSSYQLFPIFFFFSFSRADEASNASKQNVSPSHV